MVARPKLTRLRDAIVGDDDDDRPLKKDETTGKFVKGNKTGGRLPGSPNKITRHLKEALILAAERHGSDKKGKDGLVGYLYHLARYEPRSFASLLGKLLPFQITGKDGVALEVVVKTREDVAKQMQERGLPVPASVFDQAIEVRAARSEAAQATKH